MDQILEKLKNKQDLTFEESKTAFEILMTGKASDDEIFNFLTLLSEKGEVSDEIAGGVFVLREKSKRVNVKDCIDTCGTGGDGMNTLNISTAVEILRVFMPSPPVPQVSIQSFTFTLFDFSLRTKTPPAISSETSPFSDSKVKKLKISSSLAFPVINISKAVLLSSKVKSCLFLSFSKI